MSNELKEKLSRIKNKKQKDLVMKLFNIIDKLETSAPEILSEIIKANILEDQIFRNFIMIFFCDEEFQKSWKELFNK